HRGAGRRGKVEQGGRGAALHHAAHGGGPPHAHLREAGRALARRAGAPTADSGGLSKVRGFPGYLPGGAGPSVDPGIESTERAGAMKRPVLLLAVATVAISVVAAGASASNAPVRITFDKSIADPATLLFIGTVSGDVSGGLTTQLTSLRVSGPVWHV